MQCHEVQELLSAYLDGMLDPSEKERVDRHLPECRACRAELDDLKMVLDLVRDLPPLEPPAQFRQELRNKLSQAAVPERSTGILPGLARGKWSVFLAAAASFLLVFGLASDWYGIPGKLGAPSRVSLVENQVARENAAQDSHSGSGEIRLDEAKRKIIMPDAPGPAGALSFQTDARPERIAAPVPESPASFKGGNAPLPEDAGQVQGRKIASEGYGGAGVAGRGTNATSAAAGGAQPKQAAIEVRVEDRQRAVREIMTIAQRLGGVAAVLPGDEGREIIFRVPGDQFEKAVIEIGKTGTVLRQDYPPYDKEDLIQSISSNTGILPGALEIEKLGRGWGGTGSGEAQPAGTMVLKDGPKPDPTGGMEKKEAFSAPEGGTSTATIKIRLE